MSVGKFILGIIIAAVGFLLIWKSEWLINNFGRINFAEQHLGSAGGSRLMYKLIGSIIIFVGLMIAFDLSDNVLAWFAGLFGGNKK